MPDRHSFLKDSTVRGSMKLHGIVTMTYLPYKAITTTVLPDL